MNKRRSHTATPSAPSESLTRGAGSTAPVWLFRHRGLIAAALVLPLVVRGEPSFPSMARGLAPLTVGLLLRLWAIRAIGGAARTRDPSAPPRRVRSGPYARLDHPLYVANTSVLGGVVLQWAPPPWEAAALFLAGVLLWVLLAWRESSLPMGPDDHPPLLPLRRALRIERSTLVPLLVAQLVLIGRIALR